MQTVYAVFGCDMASTDAGIVMTGAELAEIQVESALGPIPTIPSRFGPVTCLRLCANASPREQVALPPLRTRLRTDILLIVAAQKRA